MLLPITAVNYILCVRFNAATVGWLPNQHPYKIDSMRLICCVAVCALALCGCGKDWTPKRIVAITDYVPLARQARTAGDVEIKCTLAADGSVTTAEVISGHPLLGEQARRNALLWKFQRTSVQRGGSTVTLKYQYRLEGEPVDRVHTVFVVDLPNTIRIIAPTPTFNP